MNVDMFPYDQVIEALDLAAAYDTSWDVGLDMLLNNVADVYLHEDGKDPYWYSCESADKLDYHTLNEAMTGMSAADITHRKNIFREVYNSNYAKYSSLRSQGKNAELHDAFLNDVTAATAKE